MSRAVALVPIAVVAALVLLPSGEASHLSMDMPGLGGAAVPPPSFLLLGTTALAALLQGAWLLHARRARDAGLALALAPLAVSAARAASIAPSLERDVGARIAELGGAGAEHMWALLAALALVVGFGAARTLEGAIEWRAQREPEAARARLAACTLLLSGPFVGLIVASSTGLDWVSSWIRWGGCGVAAIVCAGNALVPGRGEARVLGGIHFALAAALALLAEREYVEALGHDALVRRDPFDPSVEWVRGLQQIAVAIEPRERYGPALSMLPALALVSGASWRAALPRLATGLAVLAAGVLVASAISAGLDSRARIAAGAPAPSAREERPEIVWSTRALPRTAPWLRAMSSPTDVEPREPPASPVHCAAWTGQRTDG